MRKQRFNYWCTKYMGDEKEIFTLSKIRTLIPENDKGSMPCWRINLALSLSATVFLLPNHLLTRVCIIRSASCKRMIPRRCMPWSTWINRSVWSAMKWGMSSRNSRSWRAWSILFWWICGKCVDCTSEWTLLNPSANTVTSSHHDCLMCIGQSSLWFSLLCCTKLWC